MRFKLHSPETVGAIKIDWDAQVELTPDVRAAMAPHDLDTMRAGTLVRGFALGGITYPRGTIAFRVAEAHELFLQIPDTEPAPVKKVVVPSTWTVEPVGEIDRHRGTIGTKEDGERIDLVISTGTKLSRTKAQRLIEEGRVRIAGRTIKKLNHRVHVGAVIEVDAQRPD